MAEKMKQKVILKILDAVRKAAVKGAYLPSLLSRTKSMEQEVIRMR